jgi:hypothetical protein
LRHRIHRKDGSGVPTGKKIENLETELEYLFANYVSVFHESEVGLPLAGRTECVAP